MGYILIGDEQIDIRGLYNITSHAQLTAIAFLIRKITISNQDHLIFLHEKIKKALEDMEREGVDIVFSSFFPGFERWLELPRINEVLSVINQMKHLNFFVGVWFVSFALYLLPHLDPACSTIHICLHINYYVITCIELIQREIVIID
jgi:hypothetical protein